MEFNLDWDSIKEQIKDAVEIEKDESKKQVKIKFKGDISRNPMVDKMVGDDEGLQKTLTQFVGKGEQIDCNIKFIEAENAFLLENFKDEKTTNAVYEFFNDLFFGDFLKNLMEHMMDAFGNLGDLLKE
ncbi:MAG: hypothetical protein ACFFDN_24650 [Candidatus Hodarchaeota archaeon]